MFGDAAVAFVVLTSLALFTSGEIFALFPALTADRFGSKSAAANQGMLYTERASPRWPAAPSRRGWR